MWSLFHRHSNVSSGSEADTSLESKLTTLFAELLEFISDDTARSTFSKQFKEIHSTSEAILQMKAAPVFVALLTYLTDHQPPALKAVVTQEDIQRVIANHVTVADLDPALIGALGTGVLQLAGILGYGVDQLVDAYQKKLESVVARQSLDDMLKHLPYQVPPESYSDLTGQEKPMLKPLYVQLANLGQDDLIGNIKYLYQHYLELLVNDNQQLLATKVLQDAYGYISQTYHQNQTLIFLDVVPSGWLEQERGNLLGRQELLKVLDELQAERTMV